MQDCSISSALTMEILKSCTRPLMFCSDILCGIPKMYVLSEIPYKITYSYIERFVFYLEVNI